MIRRQAHLKRTVLLPLTLASVAWGCTESADLLESREQGIIFDVRKTHQSRILLDKVSTVSDPDERNRFAQSAFLLTGTARLTYTGVYSKDETCNLIGDESVSGSSQLISPTRVVTAHHNISRAQPEEFQLAFDSSPRDEGGWVNDADWDDEEENPLLSNRLFQIGLDFWAQNRLSSGQPSAFKTTTRPRLRRWKAMLDLEGTDVGAVITGQPFVSNPDKMLDISFLKVTSLNEPIEFSSEPGEAGYIQSTPFNISQPGLFFNQAQARSFDGAVHQKTVMSLTNNTEEQTKLQLLGSPPWIDIYSDFSGEYAPVACVSGATDDPNPVATCAQRAYCLGSNQSPIDSKYIRCIRTSLDSVGGSRGGAMLMAPPYFSEPDGKYYRDENIRHAYGVLNGATNNEGMPDAWGDASKVKTDNGFPTSEGFTLVTVGNADYERWGKRTATFNGGTDLFNPGPLQPATDNSPPCEPMASGGCVFSLSQSNTIWGTPEVGAPVLDFKDAAPTNQINTESIRLSCDYGRYYGDRILNKTFRTKAGVAVGLIGTSTQSYLTEETAVASLGVICAPWSTASWSDNWNWMLKHMRHLQGGGNARENSVWQPILRLALPFMAEWRRETPKSAPYVRPMSMKLCPPNYVIKGVGLWHDEETLLGVTKLLCQNPQGQRHEAVLQPLETPDTTLAWRYTFKGRAFSIAQHIGNASGSRGYYKELECGEGQVVGGIQLSKSSNTPVRSLWLECMPAPGSL